MKNLLLRTAAGWIAAAVLFSVQVSAVPAVSAEKAVLLDVHSGRVLHDCRGSERSLIASTTKIMTGLLIAEECDLSAEVQIPAEAVGTEGSSLYLKAGEIVTVEELLYGLMLHSGNDAAVALAMYSAGSVEAFADKMNRKAEELDLHATHFVNPHGLDAEEHYSTALDLAKLAAYAMKNPVFYEVVSSKTAVYGDRSLTNHNKMLWRYEGAVGVKTGYTKAAGRILVSAAERDGRMLIAVTIHAPNDWKDHTALLDYGFQQYPLTKVAKSGQQVAEIPVLCGAEETADVVLRETVEIPLSGTEEPCWEWKLPPFVFAPVLAGEQAGTVVVRIGDRMIGEYPLYWKYSVFEEA